MDWSWALSGFRFFWTITNLVVLLAVILGFVLIVVSLWKQAKAQERMAASLQEIVDKLNRS